jgi:putative membrane protein
MDGFVNNMGNFGWGHGFGVVFMILFWGLVIVGIVAIVKWLSASSQNSNNSQSKTALDILNERYVRGEIEREEFEQKKQDLML